MLKWTAFLGANKVPSQLWPIMSPMSRTLSGLTQMLGWIEFLGPNKVPLQLRPTMSTCHVHWTHLNSLHIPLVWKNSTQIISSPELALWNELPGIGFTIADLRDDYWSWVNTCYNYLMVLCSISGSGSYSFSFFGPYPFRTCVILLFLNLFIYLLLLFI